MAFSTVIIIKTKTGEATIDVEQIAALEKRNLGDGQAGYTWIYLKSGVGFESSEEYRNLLEKLEFLATRDSGCNWSDEENSRHAQHKYNS